MNDFLAFDRVELWQLAGWTMLHYLWLGTLVGLAAAVCRLVLRRAPATVRYIAALASLIVLALLPLAIAAWVAAKPQAMPATRSTMSSLGIASTVRGPDVVASQTAATPPADVVELSPTAPAESNPRQRRTGATGSASAASEPPEIAARSPDLPQLATSILQYCVRYLPWLWLLGTPLTFALLTTGIIGAERLRRASRTIDDGPIADACARLAHAVRIGRRVTVAVCERIAAPVLVGIVRPIILLPPSALSGWSPDEIEMVLLHELAHVRRWDNLVNLLQRLIESLLFFHPSVWLVSNWVRREREACCDAVVVGRTNRPHAYAEMLVALAAQMPRSVLFHPAASTAMAAGPMRSRIRRILGLEDDPMLISGKSLAAVMSGLLLVATLVVLNLPTRTEAEESATTIAESTQRKDAAEEIRVKRILIESLNGRIVIDADKPGVRIPNNYFGSEAIAFEIPAAVSDDDAQRSVQELTEIEGIQSASIDHRRSGERHLNLLHKRAAGDARIPQAVWVKDDQGKMHCRLTFVEPPSQRPTRGEADEPADGRTNPAPTAASMDAMVDEQLASDPNLSMMNHELMALQYQLNQQSSVMKRGRSRETDQLQAQFNAKLQQINSYRAQVRAQFEAAEDPKLVEVPFVVGASSLLDGDKITIEEVRGTAAAFEPGNVYWIKGKYTLGSRDRATLLASTTATHAAEGNSSTQKIQTTTVDRGSGEFTLWLPMTVRGWPHVSFYPADGGEGFGGIYFGTGDSVLKKWWSSMEPATEAREDTGVVEGRQVGVGGNLPVEVSEEDAERIVREVLKNPAVRNASIKRAPDGMQMLITSVVSPPGKRAFLAWKSDSQGKLSCSVEFVTGASRGTIHSISKTLPIEVDEEEGQRIVDEISKDPAVEQASIGRYKPDQPQFLSVTLKRAVGEKGEKAFLAWKTDSQGRLTCSVQYISVAPDTDEQAQQFPRDRTKQLATESTQDTERGRENEPRKVSIDISQNQRATAESQPGRLRLQIRTTESKGGKFPSLEDQKLADFAYRRIGWELEPIGEEELKRVQALGYEGGVRVTGFAPNRGWTGVEKAGDVLVGLHVWPTTSLKDVTDVLNRDDLAELSPLKFYVIRRGAGSNQSGAVREPEEDRVVTGRISVQVDKAQPTPGEPLGTFTQPNSGSLLLTPTQPTRFSHGTVVIQDPIAASPHLSDALAEAAAKSNIEPPTFDNLPPEPAATGLTDVASSAAPTRTEEPGAPVGATDNRSNLRYNGKTFDQWRDAWRTELSTEKRLEVVKALAAFGASGRGRDAADAIVSIAGQYDWTSIGENKSADALKQACLSALGHPEFLTVAHRIPEDDVVPAIVNAVDSNNVQSRLFAAWVLPALAQRSDKAAEAFLRLSSDSDAKVRSYAFRAMHFEPARINNDFVEGNRIRQQLLSNDPQWVRAGIRKLVKDAAWFNSRGIATDEGPALNYTPELFPLLFDPDESVRREARQALRYVQNATARGIVEQLLSVLDENTRRADQLEAIRGIAAIGPKASRAQGKLKQLLTSSDEEIRIAAAAAIKMIVGKDQYQKPVADVLGEELGITVVESGGVWGALPREDMKDGGQAFNEFTDAVIEEQQQLFPDGKF